MNFFNRILRGLFVFTALLLSCISLTIDCLFERGILSDTLGDCIKLFEAQRKGEELAQESHKAFKRYLVKSKIAEALMNGEMTLIDAAAFFRSLHEDPKSWHYPNRPRPEPEDGASWCREVIEWTQRYTNFQQSPSQADKLHQRLHTELQKLLEGHSSLTLPE